ncbi:hypothetical protein CYMTET_35037 [Cymbomonas tetramitiformis]|uniref:Uncharacterized protein n=1 Tax=Cymbomonas tetramitiformis TaxID=36881 RepID=A0AAE0FAG4_9CHLO|nr:hypothetical protein CYMTET_35037 [Cymbomonas tetramitiformis]
MSIPPTLTFEERWSLKGKTALVTGGTRGLGYAIVEELGKLGATVFTCARTREHLDAALTDWKASGLDVHGCVADMKDLESRKDLIREAGKIFKSLDILVNNVGTNIRKPTEEFTPEEFHHIMATNLESAFSLSQLAHPLLAAAGNSSIVFNSSVAGVVALRSGSVYAATKGTASPFARPGTLGHVHLVPPTHRDALSRAGAGEHAPSRCMDPEA